MSIQCIRVLAISVTATITLTSSLAAQTIGEEKAVSEHLADGAEFALSVDELFAKGRELFAANWTVQDGQGRPLTKGTGAPLSDPTSPLVFPRNMNRVSAMDANSCAGCHNVPRTGGSGDFVTNVVVLGQRFDFATFDAADPVATRGAVDEAGTPVTLDDIGNSRQTVGMFGAGYVEMLARQITADLQAIRDSIPASGSASLVSKGISFGVLSRDAAGAWDTTLVEGLPAPSVATSGPGDPPNLLIRPFHQAGAVISLRQFTNNAMNHHHGMQSSERFGAGADPDGDGVVDELTIADITATSMFQAGLEVPGRVLPRNPDVREAIRAGEDSFVEIGCASCHVPSLPLDEQGWIYTEPNPYNPAGNLRPGDDYVATYGALELDLTSPRLPQPRLQQRDGVVEVFAFTDFKLHDITSGPMDPNREALDMHGAPPFATGNSHFLTGRLWGVGNQMPFFHHGKFTTLREAVEAHAGEASGVMARWDSLAPLEQSEIIEFLKSLRILDEGTRQLAVDERGRPVNWPAFPWVTGQIVPSLP